MDASEWAKRVDKNPKESKALAAVSTLPKSPKPGRVLVPFEVGSNDYDRAIGKGSLKRRIAEAPVERVPTGKLVTNGQKSVRVDQLEHYISRPNASGSDHGGKGTHGTDHPIVVKIGGRHIIYDGHHRATAAVLRGEKAIDARVVDLDSPPKKTDKG